MHVRENREKRLQMKHLIKMSRKVFGVTESSSSMHIISWREPYNGNKCLSLFYSSQAEHILRSTAAGETLGTTDLRKHAECSHNSDLAL